ncbi:MAG: site-specific integrase, partial [Coprobacillus sp.]
PLIRIHDLRHSHASYLINNMSDKYTDFDVAKRLGDTVQTLHDTYAHWFKQADKAIIEMMDGKAEAGSKYDELKELKELLDLEIITKEEFNLKKKEILGI